MFTNEICARRMTRRLFMPLCAAVAYLGAAATGMANESSELASLDAAADRFGPDFNVKCRLAQRTDLTDLQGKVLAILGSDTFVNLEELIANAGWVSLSNYVAQPYAGSTVAVAAGVLHTVADSVFISQPEQGGGSILGLVLSGQEFQILETREIGLGSERVRFHKIRLRGKLIRPVFKDCQRSAWVAY